jgi:hypothetical protein
VDFAFTLMNPLTMHHSKVIPEIYRQLGRPGEGADRLDRWYRLRDSMGAPTDAPHQKVRLMKEYHRDKMLAEVFDDDPAAKALYTKMEARERLPPEDTREGLGCLKSTGKALAIVSEVLGTQGARTVSDSMNAHGLEGYFEEIITPSGRFTLQGALIEEGGFSGATKKDGTMYDRLAGYLDSRGFGAGRRAMIGDDPKLDVEFSKKRGFVAIQYCGILDRGRSEAADFRMSSWSEICRLL